MAVFSLGPNEEFETGEERRLGGVRMLRLQYGLVHLTRHLAEKKGIKINITVYDWSGAQTWWSYSAPPLVLPHSPHSPPSGKNGH